MKSFVLIFVLATSYVAAQDVSIPDDLLNKTSTIAPSNETTTNGFGNNNTTEEITSPPDALIDARDPGFSIPTIVNPPCEIIPPIFRPFDPTRRPPINRPPITEDPIDRDYDSPVERDVDRRCPIGTYMNGTVCVSIYSNDCPHDYVWRNNRCVLSHMICPLNFEWDGRSCAQRRICPSNHIWKNGSCILPSPDCPTGWRWNGNVCEVNEIQCQPGSVRNGSSCVYEKFTCPQGYIEEHYGCRKPSTSCPPGYSLELGFCIRTRKWCPEGSLLENDRCRTIIKTCPEGTYRIGDKCYRDQPPRFTTERWPETTRRPWPTQTTRRSYPTCPDGFILYDNKCYKCPLGFKYCNRQCIPNNKSCYPPTNCDQSHPCRPSQREININVHTNNHGSSRPSSNGGYNIVNNIEPIVNHIVNHNNVTHPVTLNNVNKNNIFIYSDTQCPDGSIGTIVTKNNETFNGCVDARTGNRNKTEEKINVPISKNVTENNSTDVNKTCCEIVTPRQCKKRSESQWICSHRRYNYCGAFCIADRFYLRPRATTYHNKVLIIAPQRPEVPSVVPCFGRRCPDFDCSGCTDGSFNCSSECYTYPCNHDECHYLDQDDFCGTVGGEVCNS